MYFGNLTPGIYFNSDALHFGNENYSPDLKYSTDLNNAVNENRNQHSSGIHFLERHGQESSSCYAQDHDQENGKTAGDIPQESVHVTEHAVCKEERFPDCQSGSSNG